MDDPCLTIDALEVEEWSGPFGRRVGLSIPDLNHTTADGEYVVAQVELTRREVEELRNRLTDVLERW